MLTDKVIYYWFIKSDYGIWSTPCYGTMAEILEFEDNLYDLIDVRDT